MRVVAPEGTAKAAARSATRAAFSQYGRFQMMILSRIVSILVILWIVTFVIFAIIRLFTGVSIKRIGYFSLRHIHYTPKPGIDVRIGKIGITIHRPTVAIPGWVTFTIANCHIQIEPTKIISEPSADSSPIPDRTAASSSPASETAKDEEHDALHDAAMRKGVPLIPPKMQKFVRPLRWLLKNLKVGEIHFHGISIDLVGLVTLVTTQGSVRLDVRASPNLRQANFIGTLDEYQMAKDELPYSTKFQLVDVYIAKSLEDENPHQLLENFVLDVSGVLNLTEFRLKEMAIVVSSQRLVIPMDTLLGILQKVKQHRANIDGATASQDSSDDANAASPKKPTILSDRDRKHIVNLGFWTIYLVKRVEMNLALAIVSGIPHHPSGLRFAARLKDLNIDISRMNPNSPGFKLLYQEDDAAHQAIFTFASLNIGVESGEVQEELLYVPLVTCISRGNVYSKTLRYFQDDDASRNESQVRSHWSVHSPTVNISRHNLPMILQFVRATRHLHTPQQTGESDAPVEPFRIQMPFQNLLPKTEIVLSISDLALRLVIEEVEDVDSSSSVGDAMFIWGCEHVLTTVSSTHTEADGVHAYNVTGTAEVSKAGVWYRSTSTSRIDLSNLNKISLNLKAVTQPQLSVDIGMNINGFRVTAVQYEVFHKIRQLYLYVTRSRHAPSQDAENAAKITPVPVSPQSKPKRHRSGLRKLPPWLTTVNVVSEEASIAIASDRFRGQTGDLLGPKLAVKKLSLHYQAASKDSPPPTPHESGDQGTGRKLRLQGEDLRVYKVTTIFWKHADEDENLERASRVIEVNSFGFSMETKHQSQTQIKLTLPKIVLSLNINLVLAGMVIHEVVDHALGNDLRKAARRKVEARRESAASISSVDSSSSATTLDASSGPREEYVLDASFRNVRIKLDLPSNDEIMLEVSQGQLVREAYSNPILRSKALRLYSKHPFQHNAWCIIMSFVGVSAEIRTAHHLQENEDRVKLDIRGVRINVPFRFRLYRIIDNGITLGKGLKTLILQTRLGDTDIVLDPKKISKLPNVPRIRLHTKALLLSLEDDHFESDLSMIFGTMLNAAAVRRNKTRIIEKKIKLAINEKLTILKKRLEDSSPDDSDSNVFRQQMAHNVVDAMTNAADVFVHPSNHHLHHAHHNSKGEETNGTDEEPHAAGSSLNNAKSKIPSMIAAWRQRSKAKVLSRTQLIEKLERLLIAPFELTCDDASSSGHLVHPWIEFWQCDSFKDFRANTYISARIEGTEITSDSDDEELPKLSLDEVRKRLLVHFSQAWIRMIDACRKDQHAGAAKTMEGLVPDELDPVTCEDEMIVDYSQKPLLFSAAFRDLDLTIAKTSYQTSERTHQFMHDIGKGLPLDTEFSIWIPLYIDIKAQGGLRVDLLDYPLPVVHFPGLSSNQDPNKNTALRVFGDLIITEELVHDKKNIRQLFMPLKMGLGKENAKQRGVNVIEVHRTLSPIKTYTDLSFKVESDLPSRVTWCNAYKPGFHGVGTAFSSFSKPPLDLSSKLGFWDKIRLVLHARLHFELPKSALYLMLKSGRDPYSLLNENAGFAFVWRDGVKVEINPDDNPKNLFVVTSKTFQLVVPDYAAWETDYLHRNPGTRAYPYRTNYTAMQKPSKLVFQFGNLTTWKLGMEFQKRTANGERDSNFRHHYDVRLSMPQYVEDYESYDAYSGFRSDFIFLAISLSSRNEEDLLECSGASKNAAHLTPRILRHFSIWKDQFSGSAFPAIRSGSLYPVPSINVNGLSPKPPITTFGTALSGAQYQIALCPLDLGFFHLLRDPGHLYSSHSRCTGLKIKADRFVFDWHTRREPQPGSKRWRMKSFLGEVDIQSVDVRVIETRFHSRASTKAELREIDPSFVDTDSSSGPTSSGADSSKTSSHLTGFTPRHFSHDSWIDLDDYTDLDRYSKLLADGKPSVKVHTFMYTPRFSYFRRTDNSDRWVYDKSGITSRKFGAEVVHDCLLSAHHPENIQSQLLAARQTELSERISDMEASLESLASDKDYSTSGSKKANAALAEKVSSLKRLIHIAKAAHSELDVEIVRCQRHLKYEDEIRTKHQELAAQEDERAALKHRRHHSRLSHHHHHHHHHHSHDDSSESTQHGDESQSQGAHDLSGASRSHTNGEIPVMRTRLSSLSEEADETPCRTCHSAPGDGKPLLGGEQQLYPDAPKRLSEEPFGPADLLRDPRTDTEEFKANVQRAEDEAPVDIGEEARRELSTEEAEMAALEDFVNRFVIHAVHVKWNDSVRNILYRLRLALGENKETSYNKSQRAVQYLQELIAKAEAESEKAYSQEGSKDKTAKKKAAPTDVPDDEFISSQHISATEEASKNDSKTKVDGTPEDIQFNDDEPVEELNRQVTDGPSINLHDADEMEDLMAEFFGGLVEKPDGEEIKRSYSILLLTPRIQFQSEKNPTKVVMVTARAIESQIVDSYDSGSKLDEDSTRIEQRIGVAARRSNVFVLGEDDVSQLGFTDLCLEPYSLDEGEKENNWPPWTALELCYNPRPLSNFMIIEDANLAMRLDRPNDLHVSESQGQASKDNLRGKMPPAQTSKTASNNHAAASKESMDGRRPSLGRTISRTFSRNSTTSRRSSVSRFSFMSESESEEDNDEQEMALNEHNVCPSKSKNSRRLTIDAPRITLKMDSVQAFTTYMIATDLISYKDPVVKDREKAIERIVFATDFTGDFSKSLRHVRNLQKDVRLAQEYLQLLNLKQMKGKLAQHVHKAQLLLEREYQKATLELLVVMRAFKTGLRKAMNSDTDRESRLSVLIGRVAVHILDQKGHLLVDLVLERLHYARISSSDNFSINRASVRDIAGRNRITNAVYPHIISSYDKSMDEDDVVTVQWTSLDPVGGIPILENAAIYIQPLKVRLERRVVDQLMEFAFPMRKSRNLAKEEGETGDDEGDDDDGDILTDSDSSITPVSTRDSSGGETKRPKKLTLRKRLGHLIRGHDHDDNEISRMVDRASSYVNILQFSIFATRLSISYKGRASRNLLDLQDVEINVPDIIYLNKMWTRLDLVMRLKRDLVRILLKQAGSLIGNKFVKHRDIKEIDDPDEDLKDVSSTYRHLVEHTANDGETIFTPQHRVDPEAFRASQQLEDLNLKKGRKSMDSSRVTSGAGSTGTATGSGTGTSHHHHHMLSLHHHKSRESTVLSPTPSSRLSRITGARPISFMSSNSTSAQSSPPKHSILHHHRHTSQSSSAQDGDRSVSSHDHRTASRSDHRSEHRSEHHSEHDSKPTPERSHSSSLLHLRRPTFGKRTDSQDSSETSKSSSNSKFFQKLKRALD